jgi:hypothetical protein
MAGREVIARNDQVRLCCGDRVCEGSQWSQPVIGVCPLKNAGLSDRLPRRAHGFHSAAGIRKSHRQTSSRQPVTGGRHQHRRFRFCRSFRKNLDITRDKYESDLGASGLNRNRPTIPGTPRNAGLSPILLTLNTLRNNRGHLGTPGKSVKRNPLLIKGKSLSKAHLHSARV